MSLTYIENCLRILDSLLLRRWEVDDDGHELGGRSKYDRKTQHILDKARQDGLAQSLIALCLATEILRRQPNAKEHRETGIYITPFVRRCLC